jgi:hypothetical protein
MGRHSKRLQLQGGKQVVVRKMACHSGFAYGASGAVVSATHQITCTTGGIGAAFTLPADV